MLLSPKCRAHGGGIVLNLFGLTACCWGEEEGKRSGFCGTGGSFPALHLSVSIPWASLVKPLWDLSGCSLSSMKFQDDLLLPSALLEQSY